MKYSVYILISKKSGRYYIGQTKNVEQRLERHNQGRSKFTRLEKPCELFYTEEYTSRSDAIKRERYLKSPKGWKELQELKRNIKTRNVAQPG